MNLLLLTGRDAIRHADSDDFRARWITLYESCPWATACQHPDFVLPWYEFYGSAFLPVLVVHVLPDGALGGLLPLALDRNGVKLTGAGNQQAEYQGWIQAPGTDSTFIVRAIQEIRTAFREADVFLKYLPPGIPLHWLSDKDVDGKHCVLRTHRRPLMKIDAEAMSRQRSKKNHRQNYNRLRRLGEVGFESVVQEDHFTRALDEISLQYDFRQAALFRSMPFANDPFKKPFQIALHRRGLLHTTVLTVGGNIAASHVGLISKARAVHLGINTYDPALAAHSPGNLLLAMLGVHLVTENVPFLDLTPGGDKYKEQFATEYDSVSELIIYRDTKRRLLLETGLAAVKAAKTGLRAAGYRPADVLAALEKLKGVRSLPRPASWARGRGSNGRPCALRYAQGPRWLGNSKLAISKNRLHDVIRFDAQGSSFRYRAFMDTVMKRMERSNDLFSHVLDGKLQIFCWVRSCTAEQASQQPGATGAPGGHSLVVHDLYVHRDIQDHDRVRDFLARLLQELTQTHGNAAISYRGALSDELQTVLKRCGFVEEVA